jgi:2-polyprenyl-6-methoxyphenol hydroxylase-like FAD-dependent oxidoreductase
MRIQLPNKYYDVVVVGGGMVGASFACALRR